tara:strand:+ start:71 stop:316 length:246 start_codon:yes stop_codon:yes gene_type:complete
MKQAEKNIAYCIDECNMNDEQIGEMLRCIERENIASVEHFLEEFVFICYDEDGVEDVDHLGRLHDPEYLNIAEFNALYWEH